MPLGNNCDYVEVPLDESLLDHVEEERWYDAEYLERQKMLRRGFALLLAAVAFGLISFYCYSMYQGEVDVFLKIKNM